MTWIDAIISNLLAIVTYVSPIRICRSYQRLVIFRWGIPHRVGQPGLNWVWPFKIEVSEVTGVNEETRNLLSQSVTTADGTAVTFSCNLCFIVVDPTLYYTAVYNFEQSIDALSMTHLHARTRKLSWEMLRTDEALSELERSLKGTLTTKVKKWGVEMISVGFTDLVPSRAYRFFGDSGTQSMRNDFMSGDAH